MGGFTKGMWGKPCSWFKARDFLIGNTGKVISQAVLGMSKNLEFSKYEKILHLLRQPP